MKLLYQLFFLDEEKGLGKQLLLISLLGPICLLVGLVCTLLKCAFSLWPIIAAAFLGFFLTCKWKQSGLVISLIALSAIMIGFFCNQDLFWASILSISVALSWLLVFLGQQEVKALIQASEDRLCRLQEKNISLLADLHIERESWKQKWDQASLEMSHYRTNEKTLQNALQEAQQQILKITEKKEDSSKDQSLDLSQVKLAQLKVQFDEKSDILNKTRKKLFETETQWLTLQKQIEENACVLNTEEIAMISYLRELEEENRELELHLEILQECVSFLLIPKKLDKRKNTEAVIKQHQDDLFLLLRKKSQSKIGQNNPEIDEP